MSKLKGFTVTFKCFVKASWSVTVVQLSNRYSDGYAATPGNVVYYSQSYGTPTLVVVGVSAYVRVCSSSTTCYNSAAVAVTA